MSPTEPQRDRAYPVAVALLSLLYLAGSLLWALTTPPFHGPDESLHYNSVNRVLGGGGWPEPYTAKVEASTWRAVGESTGSRVLFRPSAVRELAPVPPGARSAMDDGEGLADQGRDQMVQHPPTFYALGAGVVAVAGGSSMSWDHALVVLRALSALLTAASIPFIVGAGRRFTGSRRAGLVGGIALLAIPFFTTMGGYVTNDSLLLLTTSAALYFAVRALDATRQLPWLAASGVALGAALLTKGLALFLIPVIGVLTLLAVLARPSSFRRRMLLLALPQAIAFVVGGWWWLRNVLTLGAVQPSQCGSGDGCTTIAPDDPPPPDTWFFAVEFVKRFSQTFWGRGGIEALAYPHLAVTVATALVAALVLAALLVTRRRAALLGLLAAPVLITLILITNAYGIYVDLGVHNRGVQGRYIFSTVTALAISAAVVWDRLDARGRGLRLGATGVLLLCAAVAAAGWWWVIDRMWVEQRAGWRQGLAAATEATGTSVWMVGALLLVLVATVMALAGLLTRPVIMDEARTTPTPTPARTRERASWRTRR